MRRKVNTGQHRFGTQGARGRSRIRKREKWRTQHVPRPRETPHRKYPPPIPPPRSWFPIHTWEPPRASLPPWCPGGDRVRRALDFDGAISKAREGTSRFGKSKRRENDRLRNCEYGPRDSRANEEKPTMPAALVLSRTRLRRVSEQGASLFTLVRYPPRCVVPETHARFTDRASEPPLSSRCARPSRNALSPRVSRAMPTCFRRSGALVSARAPLKRDPGTDARFNTTHVGSHDARFAQSGHRVDRKRRLEAASSDRVFNGSRVFADKTTPPSHHSLPSPSASPG